MTDFDYGLANHAIRVTSDRSDCVFLWFWPQMTAIRDRIIAAAKQDMWEARREPRGQVFVGSDRANSAIYQWTSCAPGRDWSACGSSTGKPPPRSWHGRRRTASSLPMTGRSFRPRPHFTEKQRLTGKIANEVRPCDGKPPSRPHQWRLWHVRFRPRHPSNRSRRPAPCYPRCHCHRTYRGKGDSILVSLSHCGNPKKARSVWLSRGTDCNRRAARRSGYARSE